MHLQARAYPTEETQIHEIQFESRQQHLEDAQTTKPNRPIFVTTYSPWWTSLRKTLTNQWNFIDTDPNLKETVS